VLLRSTLTSFKRSFIGFNAVLGVGEAAVPVGYDPALQQQQGEQKDSPPDVRLAGQLLLHYVTLLMVTGTRAIFSGR
jgi:hypothetical protein